MRYEIEHVSRYVYAAPVRGCVMSLCLKPRDNSRQRLIHFAVETDPPAPLNEGTDCFGNTKHLLNIHREHEGLEITTRSTVESRPAASPPNSLPADAWREIRSWSESFEHWDYSHPSALARPSSALNAFIDRLRITPGDDPLQSLLRLSDTLYHTFDYVPGSTTAVSPVEHILESGRGVCQDYAHVMIAIARSWGLPARYASGYLHVTGQTGEQAPETATHAWVECLLPDLGWTGFDPTNQTLADGRHVLVAVGRDYQDVSPTRGILEGGGESRLEVDVRMRRRSGAGD